MTYVNMVCTIWRHLWQKLISESFLIFNNTNTSDYCKVHYVYASNIL